MTHTKPPWEFDGNCGGYISEGGEKIARAYARDDAEFIVKAVNNFDAMVKALEQIIGMTQTTVSIDGKPIKKQDSLCAGIARAALPADTGSVT